MALKSRRITPRKTLEFLRAARIISARIAPPYAPDPAFSEKPNVPKGRVIRFTLNSAESKIFPTAPVGGARRGVTQAEPAQHQTFQRQVAVYIPAGYVPKSEAAGHVDQRVQLQTMPEAFEWVWKGYKPTGR